MFFSQLNNLGNLIFSQTIRQCYQRNSFSFSNAINTAKSTASQCISDKIDQANSIIQQARSDIGTAIQNIANGYQLISQCSQISSQYPSVAGVLARTACLQEVIDFSSFALQKKIEIFHLVVVYCRQW